jgi:hypothetical protein
MLRDGRGLIPVLGQRLETSERRIDIGLAADVGIHHAAHFEELHIRVPHLAERGPLDHFRGALRVGPIEHLDAIRK